MIKPFFIGCLLLVPFFGQAVPCKEVSLKTLDKVTGRTNTLKMMVGEEKQFGTLTIRMQACDQSKDTEIPEMTAFLEVHETKDGKAHQLFSSWMFGSSPSVSSLEHPIYDVWIDLPQIA
jgi:hypothetical protein